MAEHGMRLVWIKDKKAFFYSLFSHRDIRIFCEVKMFIECFHLPVRVRGDIIDMGVRELIYMF